MSASAVAWIGSSVVWAALVIAGILFRHRPKAVRVLPYTYVVAVFIGGSGIAYAIAWLLQAGVLLPLGVLAFAASTGVVSIWNARRSSRSAPKS